MIPDRMTAAEYNASLKKEKKSKYHAKPMVIDGIRFMSQAEAARYCQLRLLERAGQIHCLELQPKYVIRGNDSKTICTYIADFQYIDEDPFNPVVEDVKGVKTSTYKLKKKLVEDRYGIKIKEVTMDKREIAQAFLVYGAGAEK